MIERKQIFDAEKWVRSLFLTVFYYFQFIEEWHHCQMEDCGGLIIKIATLFHLPILDGTKPISIGKSILDFLKFKDESLFNKSIETDILMEYHSLMIHIFDYVKKRLLALISDIRLGNDKEENLRKFIYSFVKDAFNYKYTPILYEEPHLRFEVPYKYQSYNYNAFIQVNKHELFSLTPKQIDFYDTEKFYVIDVPYSLYVAIIPKNSYVTMPRVFVNAVSDTVFEEDELLFLGIDNKEEEENE